MPQGSKPVVPVARGVAPWPALGAALAGLGPESSGRRAVEDVFACSLLVVPAWEGEPGWRTNRRPPTRVGRFCAGSPLYRSLRRAIAPPMRGRPHGCLAPRPVRAAGGQGGGASHRGFVLVRGSRGGVAAAELPVPDFVLVLPEVFSSAGVCARWEPWFEVHLDALADLQGSHTGAFYQCTGARHEAASEPLKLVSCLPAGSRFATPGRRFDRLHGVQTGAGALPIATPCRAPAAAGLPPIGGRRLKRLWWSRWKQDPFWQLAYRLEVHLTRQAARPEGSSEGSWPLWRFF